MTTKAIIKNNIAADAHKRIEYKSVLLWQKQEDIMKTTKKLRLSKETIVNLNNNEMKSIHGGGIDGPLPPYSYTCEWNSCGESCQVPSYL